MLSVLLIGCASYVVDTNHSDPAAQGPPNFSISDINNEETLVNNNSTAAHRISFVLHNKESSEISCSFGLKIINSTEEYVKNIPITSISANKRKNISIVFTMLHGDSDIRISPDCMYS